MAPTVFEMLGGRPAVAAAVEIFYSKILADDCVSGFFQGVSMEKQRQKQLLFLVFAFGGPNEYKGRDIVTAHKKLVPLGLNWSHFYVICKHFVATLKELEVPEDVIGECVATVMTLKPAFAELFGPEPVA